MRPCQLKAALMSETQVWSVRASATVLFLRTRSGVVQHFYLSLW